MKKNSNTPVALSQNYQCTLLPKFQCVCLPCEALVCSGMRVDAQRNSVQRRSFHNELIEFVSQIKHAEFGQVLLPLILEGLLVVGVEAPTEYPLPSAARVATTAHARVKSHSTLFQVRMCDGLLN